MRAQNQNCGQWLKGLGWQKREIIISDEELRQKMSRILWQLCYRELPEIETLHTEGGKTDMDFFVRVKKSCIEKLEITLEEVSIIREAGGITETMKAPMFGNNLNFLFRYYENAAFSWCPSGSFELSLPGQSPEELATFVLDGTFRETCEAGEELTNEVMFRNNNDVKNRFFAVVQAGLFPMPMCVEERIEQRHAS